MTITIKKNARLQNTFLLLVATVMLSFIFTACEKIKGEGPVVIQDRAIRNFKTVSVGTSGRITYTISPVYSLQLKAQQNILDILETTVVNNELIVKFKNGVNVRSHQEIGINISGPPPEGINLSGSGGFDLPGELIGAGLKLRVSGSGNMQLDKVTLSEKLEVTVSGSGNISIGAGAAGTEHAKISGSGNIHTAGLTVQHADAEISGSGNIKVKVVQNLDAHISGSGSVYYAGTPQISTHISGSGNVRPL
jgi:hypothetical protein